MCCVQELLLCNFIFRLIKTVGLGNRKIKENLLLKCCCCDDIMIVFYIYIPSKQKAFLILTEKIYIDEIFSSFRTKNLHQ